MVGSSSSTSSCAFDDERRLSKREGKERFEEMRRGGQAKKEG